MIKRRINMASALTAVCVALLLAGCGPGDEAVDVDVPAPEDGEETPEVAVPADESGEPAGEALEVPTPDDADPDTARRGTITETTLPEDTTDVGEPMLVARAELEPTEGNEARGTLTFSRAGGAVVIDGELMGLTPGEHGLHIHEIGDCSAPDASSAGGHFAPDDDPHGSPEDPPGEHHVGDLGNVTANEQGYALVNIVDAEMTLGDGPRSVIGRAVIVHAGRDDLETQPTGDAGGRVACGVIIDVPRVDLPDVQEP